MSEVHDFVMWRSRSVPQGAVLTDLRGFEDLFRFDTGQPLAHEFPVDAAFHMDPSQPRARVLPDAVVNSLQVLLVSSRLRRALEAAGVSGIEYLSVRIVDQDGALASDSHVIAHPVGLVDAIDLQQSEYQPHRLVKGRLDKVTRLVVDATRVPEGRSLFKLKGYGVPVLVRRALADSLRRGSFTGLDWLELAAFPER